MHLRRPDRQWSRLGIIVIMSFIVWRLPVLLQESTGRHHFEMNAYRDDATGRLGVPSADVASRAAANSLEQRSGMRPPGKLPERKVRAAPGGFRIDLDARFAQGMTASRAADGSLRTDCGPTESPAAESEGHKE
jgi:hypothetical protein